MIMEVVITVMVVAVMAGLMVAAVMIIVVIVMINIWIHDLLLYSLGVSFAFYHECFKQPLNRFSSRL